jgi:nucleoside-diphosphate-sugar epimerase
MTTKPEVIIHQLTALSAFKNLKRFDDEFAVTNQLRTRGLDVLLEAARAAGTQRLIAQSFTGWPNSREGAPTKTEEDPLDPNPPPKMATSLAAIRYLEDTLTGASDLAGIALRYGTLYGPGTALSRGGEYPALVRKRRFPIIGDGAGIWSFVHIDDAAAATVAAVEYGAPGVYNIVDDVPAPVSEWLPYLAEVLGAKPPYRLPVWLGRLAVGDVGVSMMTQIRGSSNAKAKRDLGWQPRYRTWRRGFRQELSEPNVSDPRKH